VRKHLREKAAAVVVLNSDLHFQYCGAVAARLEKLPILCRKSGGIAEGLRIKKLLTPLVDVFVPISKAAEKDQLTNPATKRSVVVYEGVDMSEYRGAATESRAPVQARTPREQKSRHQRRAISGRQRASRID